MIKNPQIMNGTKAMKLNFYIQTNQPQYTGGRRNMDFNFISKSMRDKKMRRKLSKQKVKYKIQRPLLETLNGFLEARRCKTLETFV